MASNMIRLSKSCIGQLEKNAVMRVLDRGYLGMGVEVLKFEEALSQFFGRPAICVVNGTAALHLSLQGCGVGPGDEVLVQSLTYLASFQAISATGATPIACDVDPHTLTIDLNDARKRLTSKTMAIMPVHYAGNVGALNDVYDFARKHGLRTIEDAAHSFGSEYDGKRVGSVGDIACFSFDGIKNITSGEGGCIVTNDALILERVSDARLLGVHGDASNRYKGLRSWSFDVRDQGWRYHMSDIMAAIGLAQLMRFDSIAKTRQNLAKAYNSALSNCAEIIQFPFDYLEVVPHIYPIRVRGLKDREGLRKALEIHGIQSGFHYQPNHELTYFKSKIMQPLPNTRAIFPELLTLPMHEDLSELDVEFVSTTLKAEISKFC